jgi:hypothetical protein
MMSAAIELADRVKRLANDIEVGIGLQEVVHSVDAELGVVDEDLRKAAVRLVVDEFLKTI